MIKSNANYASLGVCATMLCKINATINLEVGINVMRMDCMSHDFF
jgi:predicted TIM-barrel enzyme